MNRREVAMDEQREPMGCDGEERDDRRLSSKDGRLRRRSRRGP